MVIKRKFNNNKKYRYLAGIREAMVKILLIMIFSMSCSLLLSQDNFEEYNLLKNYVLPPNAISFDELTIKDSLFLKDDIPFTGIAYERYDNEKLARVVSFYEGIRYGPMYIWYPNGTPQLSTNYRQGKLHGWFFGWYSNGTILYNMAINQGKYVGDYQDDDDRRQQQELPEYEGDAGSLNERD
ncbi:MAG: hypothetical protein WC179_01460 [Candidatus Cloacimonadaceae bacterium]|jgi:antitoxin component YwqK of YwqJK toxin-antitoxin module